MSGLGGSRRRTASGPASPSENSLPIWGLIHRLRSAGLRVRAGRRLREGRDAELAAEAMRRLGWEGDVELAKGFFRRLVGMIGDAGQSGSCAPAYGRCQVFRVLAFPRCRSVHTCFMRHPIDIAFVDAEGDPIAVLEETGPWRLCACRGASMVLERRCSTADSRLSDKTKNPA